MFWVSDQVCGERAIPRYRMLPLPLALFWDGRESNPSSGLQPIPSVTEKRCAYMFVAIAPLAMIVLPSTVTVEPGCVPENPNGDEFVPP
jgi:hypothetical protein